AEPFRDVLRQSRRRHSLRRSVSSSSERQSLSAVCCGRAAKTILRNGHPERQSLSAMCCGRAAKTILRNGHPERQSLSAVCCGIAANNLLLEPAPIFTRVHKAFDH